MMKNLLTTGIAALLLFCSAALPADDAKPGYRIAPGDTLRIAIFGHEDLSGEFEVDGSGRISLPLIRTIEAAGHTTVELAAAIRDSLMPDYLRDPKVSVEVIGYQPVFVLGEVRQPGSYPFATGMTVVKAIALAGGYTYRADKKDIVILRDGDGKERRLPVGEHVALRPGDVIEVPERFF